MTRDPLIIGLLLGVAVALAIACSVGLLVMRDAYQRIHFTSPVAAISMFLVLVALFIDDVQAQARFKACLIFILMLITNSILSHATARSLRIRQTGRWSPVEKERIPVSKDKGIAGAGPYAGEKP